MTLSIDRRRFRVRWLMQRLEVVTALMLATMRTQVPAHRWIRAVPELWRWRANPAGIVVAGAKRHPDRLALVDDQHALTFAELDRRSNALVRAWRRTGLGADTTIGLLCHNRAVFFEVVVAAQKLGAHLVFLNTGFAAPQLADVIDREGVDLLVHDDALGSAVWQTVHVRCMTLAEVRQATAGTDDAPVAPPRSGGRVVVLTSGTTGRPKGAVRSGRSNPLDAAGVLAAIPVMAQDTTVVAAPLFHGLGLFTANLALALGSTVVVREHFDAERALQDIAERRAAVLVVVPVMLQRILALPRRRRELYDVSSLCVVICGGAALSGDLARRFMDTFGDVLYNVYGSTEVGLATVATPRDLRRAPGTAGRPTPGVTVRVLDRAGRSVPAGITGRIFVGSGLRFDGYTGGGDKDVVAGLVATGDLGRMDRWGRLFVEGREDEMIVSGGENVFPGEIEELLSAHPDVVEAAAIGVPDEEFGERLLAFVVPRPGSALGADELKAHVRERLARFKTPRSIVFVDALPRGTTGKVLKRELARDHAGRNQDSPGKDPNTA